jgi:hypothetical protein
LRKQLNPLEHKTGRGYPQKCASPNLSCRGAGYLVRALQKIVVGMSRPSDVMLMRAICRVQ